jgi:hypothetical protein
MFVFYDRPSINCSGISLDVDREGIILEANLPCIGAINLVSFSVILLLLVCGVGHVTVRVNSIVQLSMWPMGGRLHCSTDPFDTFSSTNPSLHDPYGNGQLEQILLLC